MLNEKIANETWANFRFPEWVPEKVKAEIKSFWSEEYGRGPAAWLENAEHNKSPWNGDRVRVHGVGPGSPLVTGRWIFAWNNIGRLLADDGSVMCVSLIGNPEFEVSRDGLWRKPESKDYFTVANNACTRPAFGSVDSGASLETAGG